MSEQLLDRIELALAKVEGRIASEFDQLLKSATGSDNAALPQELRVKIRDRLKELQVALDRTGSVENLQLTTERHEDIRVRLYIVDQLVDKQIPIKALRQAELDVDSRARRGRTTGGSKRSPGSSVTQKPGTKARKEIYQATGVYAASQKLAALASAVNVPGTEQRDPVTGKASFASKDINSEMDRVPATGPRPSIAQSPDEIRRKIQGRTMDGQSNKASFGSTDLKFTGRLQDTLKPDAVERVKLARAQQDEGKAVFGSRDVNKIATDPDELRKKLEARRKIDKKSSD